MVFLCLFAHSLLFYQAFASEEHQSTMLGGDATLQCQAPRGAVITVLEWRKRDLSSEDYVFFYRNDRSYEKYQHPSFRGRVELLEPSMKDGDVSIVLKNVTFNDAGTYWCRIIMRNTGNGDRVFNEDRSLTVTEPDHTEEVRMAVGHLGKAVQNQDAEDAESVTRVAVGLGAGAVCVVFLVVVAFVVYRKRHTSPKSKSCECPGTVDEHKIESQQMIG
ncbi:myelin protein zero-like protein 2 [Archocentrus centrarchus]|uniref:myelin protein zero-like protein 2 n=1 Tax=Archocentrus centrarchus TaxID=63155 RepID=UPI0011E9B7C0|nr:myelin protein zero-like protein 2 [Archocentrus centrarchus]